MPNPYFFTHAVPSLDMFVGRKEELDEVVNGILAPTIANSYAIVGGHRMGKTSLLLAVRQKLMESFSDGQSCVVGPVFLSTQEIPKLSQLAICRRVVERLREEVCPLRGWADIAAEELYRNDLPDDQAIPALERVLKSAVRGISRGFRLVILLDEVDSLIGKDWRETFFAPLRSLVSAGSLAPHLSIVVAGTVAIHELYKLDGSPFFNVLAAIKTLRLLNEPESRTLITRPNEQPPNEEVIAEIIRLTGGQPFLVQYLMCGLWEQHRGKLGNATPSDLEPIVERYLRDRRDFRFQTDKFSRDDKLAYDEIARRPDVRVHREAVRARLGSLKATNTAIEMLVHCGAIRQYSALEFGAGGEMFRSWFYQNVTVPESASKKTSRPRPAPKAVANARVTREVIRVFVASPGDVQSERKLIKEAVDALNGNVADENGFVLQLVRWEDNSRPGVDEHGAQHWLNELLRIHDIDLLVGIFWRRFGTPTERAGSGSEEEIRTAVESWRDSGHQRPQVMLYFSQKPGTAATAEENDQYTRVLRFKEEFQRLGLLWAYADEVEFGRVIRDHLTGFILSMSKVRQASAG
jgi:hypothetical protein